MNEQELDSLKAAIVAKLIERGGDPESRIQQVGYETIPITSDEDGGGWGALLLHADGSWSVKFAMTGYSIGEKPPVDDLLAEYAAINDLGYRAFDSFQDPEKEQYIREHRNKLLTGLLAAMREALQQM